MLGEVLVGGVEIGLVPMRLGHAALEVIGHDGARCAAEVVTTGPTDCVVTFGVDPALPEGGFRIEDGPALPTGLQLIGPAFRENRLLEYAYALEQVIGFDGSGARS